jgi:uncharacterized protein (TIGR02145 family)
MGENLRVTRYNDGTEIPYLASQTAWANTSSAAYCWPNGSPSNAHPYGAIYNWYVIGTTRNVCPSGWHIPTTNEWLILSGYLGGKSVAGGKLKETGESHWQSPNNSYASDEYGFSAVGAGGRRNTGVYENFRQYADFWTPNISGGGPVWWIMWYNNTEFDDKAPGNRNYGTSLRCVKQLY